MAHQKVSFLNTNVGYNQSNLMFSTYFGGSSSDGITGLAVDSANNSIITGYTTSNSFPILHAYQVTNHGLKNIFISKFNSTGKLVFSTYFGGNAVDSGAGVAIDKNNDIYVIGTTTSKNFPTKNAYNGTYGGNTDVFVAKFTSAGQLVYSTYLGGSQEDEGTGIAIDNTGNCFVTGITYSKNFPTKNAFNSTSNNLEIPEVFVAKFTSTGTLVFSTYYTPMTAYNPAITVDSQGNSYITGTSLTDTPIKNAFQSSSTGSYDAFVAKFSSSGQLLFSTLLGGSAQDSGIAIAVDRGENVYVLGVTNSNNFPTKDAYESTPGNFSDCFISKFTSNGRLLFSTYLGGNSEDYPYNIAIDNSGYIYISGTTTSSNFPSTTVTQNPINKTILSQGHYYSFIIQFNTTGSFLFSSVIGWSIDSIFSLAVNPQGATFLAGNFVSAYPPPLKNAYDSQIQNKDIFIAEYGSFHYPYVNIPSPSEPLDYMAIGLGIATISVLIVISIISVEYKKFKKQKKKPRELDHKITFILYLKQEINHKLNKKNEPNQLSEKTLEKLEEIIQEEQNEIEKE